MNQGSNFKLHCWRSANNKRAPSLWLIFNREWQKLCQEQTSHTLSLSRVLALLDFRQTQRVMCTRRLKLGLQCYGWRGYHKTNGLDLVQWNWLVQDNDGNYSLGWHIREGTRCYLTTLCAELYTSNPMCPSHYRYCKSKSWSVQAAQKLWAQIQLGPRNTICPFWLNKNISLNSSRTSACNIPYTFSDWSI